MKHNLLTQAIQDLTQVNADQSMMDTVISAAIDKQFNEVFGPSSMCTLGGFWSTEPVCIDPKMLEEYLPVTMSIVDRLHHDLAIHDQMFGAIMYDLDPAPYTPYVRHLNESISPFSQGSRRMQVNTMYHLGSIVNV